MRVAGGTIYTWSGLELDAPHMPPAVETAGTPDGELFGAEYGVLLDDLTSS